MEEKESMALHVGPMEYDPKVELECALLKMGDELEFIGAALSPQCDLDKLDGHVLVQGYRSLFKSLQATYDLAFGHFCNAVARPKIAISSAGLDMLRRERKDEVPQVGRA